MTFLSQRDGPATCYRLQRSSEVSFEAHHFNVAAAQFMLLLGGRTVVRVDYYDNPDTRGRFAAKAAALQRAGRNGERTWVFHGTGGANVPEIMRGGFRVGGSGGVAIAHGAAYGNGVYTATGPRDALSYNGGCNMVILAQGLQGAHSEAVRAGADSWRGKAGSDWAIFRTSEQLLPVYVVHFQ